MKTKLFTVLALIILAITGFVINNSKTRVPTEGNVPPPPATQDNSWQDKFYIGTVNADNAYSTNSGNHYPNLTYLGFNLFHTYLIGDTINNRHYPIMKWKANLSYTGDNLMSDVTTYASTVNPFINDINANGERKLVIQRPKIEWLCHGQRSDYKCANIGHLDTALWFYGFQSPGLRFDK